MIRIVYITDTLMAGGVERQLVELVTRLDRNIFEPHIVCIYGRRAGRSSHFVRNLVEAHIPVSILDAG